MKEKIDPKKFHYLGRWISNVLDTDFWAHWNESEVLKKITKKHCSGDRLSVNGHFFHSREMQEAVSEESFQMAQEGNFKYFENYAVVADEVINRLEKKSKSFMLKKQFSLNDLEEFFAEFQSLFTIWLIMFPIAEGLEKSIHLQLKKHGLNIEGVRSLFGSKKDTEIIKQHKELQKFVSELAKSGGLDILKQKSVKKIDADLKEKHPDLYGKIEKHLEKYSWIGVHHFWGQPMTFLGLIKELQSEVKKYPFVEVSSKKIALPGNIEKYIDAMKMLTYWRLRCAEVSGHVVHGIWPQLHGVAKVLGISYDELYWFNRVEIIEALENNQKLSKRTAKIRSMGFGYISIGNENDEILVGSEMKEMLEKLMPKKENNAVEIKGVTASLGKLVTGIVRVVLHPDDVKKFKSGEILVSPETTPDFVQAMKLANAIVTDIGGLKSHAAIVARELGKPCIIATKIATQALKDGDMVEVDTEKGIVKILKRA